MKQTVYIPFVEGTNRRECYSFDDGGGFYEQSFEKRRWDRLDVPDMPIVSWFNLGVLVHTLKTEKIIDAEIVEAEISVELKQKIS